MSQLASTLNNVNRRLGQYFNTSAPFERTSANQLASYRFVQIQGRIVF